MYAVYQIVSEVMANLADSLAKQEVFSMIDNNIIQSLGAGSGIDSKSIVTQLTEIERAGPQQRIDDRREEAEAQISDFGLITNAMDTLKSAITALTDEEGLFSKSASYTQSDALVPTKLDTDVQAGSYAFQVNAVAQSQALNFGGFSSENDAVGEGDLTINFGSWDRDAPGVGESFGKVTTFNQDADAESFTITIDSTNNSLEGLKNAINDADMGIQASIIYDGSSYNLVLTAPSGANNELEITVAESGGGSNTDYTGLSQFGFNASMDVLDPADDFDDRETQNGADAELTLNGLSISRESNTIDDIVAGLTLDILKAAPGETVTVTVSDDKTFAEENIRGFVDAYNGFLEEVQPAFEYDEETEAYGSLANDALAKSVLSQVRSIIASAIPGLENSNYTSLTNVGIRTELDGTLSIDEDDFSEALKNQFEDVQKLFAPYTYSSASDIQVNSYGKQTEAGNYDVVITTNPTKGFFQGTAIPNDETVLFPNFDTSGKNYTFTLEVDGVESETIVVPTDITYATMDDFVSAMQSAINSDSNLSDGQLSVTVSYDDTTDQFTITSSRYGTSSSVNVVSSSGDSITDLGIAAGNGTSGVNVAGTVDGVVGFGLGNVLLPKLGEPAEGLSMIVGDNATGATVDFSRGFAGQMDSLLDQFLQKNGLFDTREDLLERRIESLDDDEDNLDRRMTAYQERLMQQFIAMENILNGLSSQGGFLDNLANTLPFTASNE